MKLNKAIIAIFAFSLWMAALNTAGIFDNPFPDTDEMRTFSSATITNLTNTNEEVTGINTIDAGFGLLDFLGASLEILDTAITNIFMINDIMEKYGVPSELIYVFYTMLILITVMGLMKLILGRSDKGIE